MTDADCATGPCDAGSRCALADDLAYTFTIDWRASCAESAALPNGVSHDFPAGSYDFTAVDSAGIYDRGNVTQWGYSWVATCVGPTGPFATGLGQVPPKSPHESPAAAFAALSPKTSIQHWPGGTLTCGRSDGNCNDNGGSVIFEVRRVCAP